MKNLLSSRKGTSLVEILVVMVVLLIGIMTIIQMFPTGFRVVKAAESQTIATRLAQQELERWKNMSANLPTGILAIDEDGNVISDQFPLAPFEGIIDSTGKRGNGLNTRMIVGETTVIPIANYFQTGNGALFGSKYTLAFSPIDTSASDSIAIRGGDMRRIEVEYPQFPYLRPGQYGIDYKITKGTYEYENTDVFHLAFPIKSGQIGQHYVSYSWWATEKSSGKSVMFSQIDQRVAPVGVYAGNGTLFIEVPIPDKSGYTPTEIVSDSDTCARAFIEQSGDWSDSPYEYKLADPILGVIAFNPAGNGVYEYTARGVRPLRARIDYRIYDLRIIREDKVVPATEYTDAHNIPIKLSLRYILDLDDPTDNPDEDTYTGLIKGSVPMPLYVVDLATGLRVDVPITKYDRSTPNRGGIDFKQGIVYLPIAARFLDFNSVGVPNDDPQPLAGRHLRFFYRADGDWSIQCQKAYSNYTRADDPSGVNYRYFALDPSSDNTLIFAACNAGKTVSVDYTYVLNNVEHKVTADSFQISDTKNNNGFYYIDLNRASHFPPDAKLRRVTVTGTSFKVRALWRDGKNWRHVDMDTSLVRDTD